MPQFGSQSPSIHQHIHPASCSYTTSYQSYQQPKGFQEPVRAPQQALSPSTHPPASDRLPRQPSGSKPLWWSRLQWHSTTNQEQCASERVWSLLGHTPATAPGIHQRSNEYYTHTIFNERFVFFFFCGGGVLLFVFCFDTRLKICFPCPGVS